jgi:hypothetical protein
MDCPDIMFKEYLKLVDIISNFDDRILMVKGWGVTFGLVTLALGFQKKIRGLFFVAALSGMCFWIIEAEIKWHQSNYYPRMHEIEQNFAGQDKSPSSKSSPLIDWSWYKTSIESRFSLFELKKFEEKRQMVWRFQPLIYSHVYLPHIITVIIGFLIWRRSNFEKWVMEKAITKESKSVENKSSATD